MALVLLVARRSWPLFLAGVVLSAIGGGANSVFIALINQALEPSGGSESTWFLPTLLIISVFCVVVLTGIGNWIFKALGERIVLEMRHSLARGILQTNLRKLEMMGNERILAHFTSDIPGVVGGAQTLAETTKNLVFVVSCMAYMVWIWAEAFVASLGVIVISMMLFWSLHVFATRILARSRMEYDFLLRQIAGLINGAKELILNRRKKKSFLEQLFDPSARSYQESTVQAESFYIFGRGITEILSYGFIAALVLWLPTFGDVSSYAQRGFLFAFFFMIGSLTGILSNWGRLGYAQACSQRLAAFQKWLDGNEPAPIDNFAMPELNEIQLRDVMFSYGSQSEKGFALGPINLTLKTGELTYVVGGNGSGKSSLGKLLTGLYEPTSGAVVWNGRVVDDALRDHYRQNFATVFFDFHLFDKLLGLDDIDMEKGTELLSALGLGNKVDIREGAFSTLNLSQGQRKRLALLLTYLEDKPAIVLDEWAADQDPKFKNFFYANLLPEMKAAGKMVVAVSHDDRFFHFADRLIKLEDGGLVSNEGKP